MNKEIDKFLELVNANFADQTPPNGPDDPRRMTVGLYPRTRLVTYQGWDIVYRIRDRYFFDFDPSRELSCLVQPFFYVIRDDFAHYKILYILC